MTRNSWRSPKDKGTPKNVAKKNASDSPERKAIGGRSADGGGEADFPPQEPATNVASPRPPEEEPLEESKGPIAKPEDSASKKNDSSSIRQDTSPSTPKAAEQRQPEEQQVKTGEVTFFEKASAVSISNSRRQRSRKAKGSGRTSEALSREEQSYFGARNQGPTLSLRLLSRLRVAAMLRPASR
jgi:hypothetical protein